MYVARNFQLLNWQLCCIPLFPYWSKLMLSTINLHPFPISILSLQAVLYIMIFRWTYCVVRLQVHRAITRWFYPYFTQSPNIHIHIVVILTNLCIFDKRSVNLTAIRWEHWYFDLMLEFMQIETYSHCYIQTSNV